MGINVQIQIRDVVARKKALEKRLVRFRVILSFTAVLRTWGPKAP